MIAPDDTLAPETLHRHALAGLRGRVEAREADGTERVEKAGALNERVVALIDLRGVLKDRLDRIRRQARVRLQHQRDRAGDDRSRHAGSTEAQVRLVCRRYRARDQIGRIGRIHRAPGVGQRHRADARRDEVRLGRPIEIGRTARTERGHRIVATTRRAVRARGADRQDPRSVARRHDAAVLRFALGVLAKVARCRHDHDAGVNQALGRNRQRIGPVRFNDCCADREVHDADLVARPVGEHPVERLDDVADPALTVRVEDLQHGEAGIGRDPGVLPVRVEAVSGNDARHVRAVAVIVIRQRLAADEVDEGRHPLVAVRIERCRAAGEVVVPARDARVDDRHTDAGAGKAETAIDFPRPDRQRRAVVRAGRRPVVVHVEHVRMRRQLLQRAVRQLEHLSVDEAQQAVLFRVVLELVGQLCARVERHDHCRKIRCRRVVGTLGQLAIELRMRAARRVAGGNGLRGGTNDHGDGRGGLELPG